MVYRIAAVDERGRIAETAITSAVGWQPGERLRLEPLSTTTVAVRADPSGLFPLTRRGHLPLPAPVRRWCGLAPGDRVLLAASREEGLVLVHTMAALEAMVTAFHAEGGDRR
ncbi:AbrB/MazE/SpoVT family DNA-binding domain-containing protein [Saccharopolyspora sp. HNM0983]|uniref:AbrB/MazE/SpoVT family DNA-binding domain-containing protein n=1 Tax=Saccharopolyspora montiporae TaxID=2781240 RepID=A0A929BAT0_9PSEU|nr:AbrB/MazE/SpoVT family DNA-binding domain-containing protein [Saccharopolyspora sp. HNM0983]MBE9376442.1 AbrB/MazE/SpoVT family DNA-binding domain-containing protein [Saccharopolyspora sp. HNM0983]